MENSSSYLYTLFNQHEQVCCGDLYATSVVPVPLALAKPVPFISINPLKGSRLDGNVTAHRNFLIEFDQGGLTPEEQMAAVKFHGLPYSTAVWSAGKSVHFVVAMEHAIDAETWRLWAEALIKAVPGADPATKNPSRFTRFPNVPRPDKAGALQVLLDVRGRVEVDVIRQYVRPHMLRRASTYRAAALEAMGAVGVHALHPLTQAFIEGKHPCHTGRNNALFKSACDMRRQNFDFALAIAKLIEPALALGLSYTEARNTIKSAYKSGVV
jgi:hypothetical protein